MELREIAYVHVAFGAVGGHVHAFVVHMAVVHFGGASPSQ